MSGRRHLAAIVFRTLIGALPWILAPTSSGMAAPDASDAGDGMAISETFAADRINDGWELTDQRGEAGGGDAQWRADGGRRGGVVALRSGELRSPLIPVTITEVEAAANGRKLLEPGIYRVTARLRAQGTPERRHCPYASKGPHHGIVHMRFYDGGGRTPPGSWFSRAIVNTDWNVMTFTAMAPQWTRHARIAVIAHPGCSIEIDRVDFSLDTQATAAFDRSDPVVLYRPDPGRWRHLPRTMAALRDGAPWRVVVLGDSIANDLYHSFFHRHVNAMYPGADMRLIQSVHGSAGWDFFLKTGEDGDEDRVRSFVLEHDPDLVVIAGMSNRDVEDLRELVRRIRAGSDAEILAVTAAVCQAHYRDSMSPPPDGSVYPVTGRTKLRAAMVAAGQDDGFAVFDMGRTWDAFLWNETRPLEWYTRDTSHLNPRGMAVVGRIMAGFFQPLESAGDQAPVTIVRDHASAATAPGPPPPPGKDAGFEEVADMPTVAEVVAQVVRVSPLLTMEQIAPYADAFRAVEYKVVQRLTGAARGGTRIVVIQQVLDNRQPTPAAEFAPDDRHRLRLGLWEHYPEHETWPVSDTLENYDARLYYALQTRPAK